MFHYPAWAVGSYSSGPNSPNLSQPNPGLRADESPCTVHVSQYVNIPVYRKIQLDSTPEIEVLYMPFERCDTKNRKRSIKHHVKYFNFRSKVQLDTPVLCFFDKFTSDGHPEKQERHPVRHKGHRCDPIRAVRPLRLSSARGHAQVHLQERLRTAGKTDVTTGWSMLPRKLKLCSSNL